MRKGRTMGLDARRSSDAQATRVPRDDQNTLRRRIGHRLHHRRIGRSGSDPVSPGRFQEPDCASNEAWGDPWWIEEGEWTQLDGGFNDVRRACRPTAAPTPSLCMPCRAATVQSRPPPPSVPGRVEPMAAPDSAPETCRSCARRGCARVREATGRLWPSPGGHERQLPGREARSTDAWMSGSFRDVRRTALGRERSAAITASTVGIR